MLILQILFCGFYHVGDTDRSFCVVVNVSSSFSMEDVLDMLSQIPYISALLEDTTTDTEANDATDNAADRTNDYLTLLSWIESHSQQQSVRDVVNSCRVKLDGLTEGERAPLVCWV